MLLLFISACTSMRMMSEDQREVITIEQHALSQDEAFTRAMRYVATAYRSANDVIQLQDRENGTIVAKGVHTVMRHGMTAIPVEYTMLLDIRDERIRFTQTIGAPTNAFAGITESEANQMHTFFAGLRASLMAAIMEEDDF